MKLTYLGTAAAEGWPAAFCNCDGCRAARRLGGRNIRTRSQALVDDALLLDFPCDAWLHALRTVSNRSLTGLQAGGNLELLADLSGDLQRTHFGFILGVNHPCEESVAILLYGSGGQSQHWLLT